MEVGAEPHRGFQSGRPILAIAIAAITMILFCADAQAGEPIETCAGSELAAAEAGPTDLDCSISGTQYLDGDADSLRDPGEPGLAGWTVYADLDGDRQRDAGEPFAVSAEDGSYTIAIPYELALAPFAVAEEAQPGWSCSAPAPDCSYAEQPFLDDDPDQEPQVKRSGRDFGARPLPPGKAAVPADAAGAAKARRGLARLSAIASCRARFVRMSVRGAGVANVSYFLDSRKLMTVIKPDSRGRFSYRIRSARMTPGVHRIRAQVTFTAASATASRTLSAAVQRCRPARPRFAG